MGKKTKLNYIDNEEFENTIYAYIQYSEKEEELIKLLDLLIENIFYGFKFKGLDFDDVKQDCFLLVLKKLKNFSPGKGKAFDYFTTVIVNNIRFLYTKEKKYNKKIQDYTESLISTDQEIPSN